MASALQAGTTWVTSLKKHSDEWCLKNGKPAITIQEFPVDILRQQRLGGFRRRWELLNGDGRFTVFQAPLIPEASQALLSKNIDAQLEIAPAAQIIVDKSRGRLAISRSPAAADRPGASSLSPGDRGSYRR
jgi:polar amino acid transport system substrate-binding protein